jgi:nucleoid-associated protein YgaU
MSDKKSTQPNLNDFFKQQGKKKSNLAKTASAQQAQNEEESKQATTEAKADLAAQTKKQNANYESSDEEKTDITLGGETATVIKDRKDVEAQKRKQLE